MQMKNHIGHKKPGPLMQNSPGEWKSICKNPTDDYLEAVATVVDFLAVFGAGGIRSSKTRVCSRILNTKHMHADARYQCNDIFYFPMKGVFIHRGGLTCENSLSHHNGFPASPQETVFSFCRNQASILSEPSFGFVVTKLSF